jgi:lambda family phage portal protein
MGSPNLLDRLIGYIAPMHAYKRHVARQLLERAYDAASPRDGWNPRRPGASADADHAADARTMRVKARALYQNVPYIRAGIDGLVSATVGTGIVPRATGREAEKLNKLWPKFVEQADADGIQDLYGLIATAYQAMEIDGEVLIRPRARRSSDGLEVPLQLQLLEIDWLDSWKNEARGPNTIINGIEYDPLGRRVNYWLFDAHPGDTFGMRRSARTNSYPVPAASIVHLFRPERPGQRRGFSRLAAVIARTRDLQLLEDAELARKNLESRLSVLASGDPAQLGNPAGTPGGAPTGPTDLGELASGGITRLPPGLNITVVEPKAAPGHVENVKWNVHLIATGMGVPYEICTGDMNEVNFSSARVRRLDFKGAVEQTQWLRLIPMVMRPIWRAFVDACFLARKVTVTDYACDFSCPKWPYVNPEQDIKADLAEVAGGLSSLSEKLRQRGYDPETVFKESSEDFRRLDELGLLQVLFFLQKGVMPDSPEQTPGAARAARSLQDLHTLVERMEQRLMAIEAANVAPAKAAA